MATDRRLTVRRPTPWDQLTCCPKMGHRPARRLGRCVVQVSFFEIEVSQMRHHMPVTRCRARGASVPDWDTCRPSGVFSKETGFGTDPAPYQVSLATARCRAGLAVTATGLWIFGWSCRISALLFAGMGGLGQRQDGTSPEVAAEVQCPSGASCHYTYHRSVEGCCVLQHPTKYFACR